MDDVENLERATLAAVPPAQMEELPGWLIGLDTGTIGRARSAVPLRHEPARSGIAREIAARYRAHGLPAQFRIARIDCFDGLRGELAAAGYGPTQGTLVQTSRAEAMAAMAEPLDVSLAGSPGADWSRVFLGEGFDPVDGTSRMGILQRAQGSLFAAVRVDGEVRAVGCVSFSHGWCGVHGMRTSPAFRGRGYAARILAAFAREAQARGTEQVFLQVEERNTGAQRLYARAGFATRWTYEYWKA